MSLLFTLASKLARTPLDPPLRAVSRAFSRYVDIAENLNNCDFDSNGEGFLVRRAAPKWSFALDVGANRGEWTELVSQLNPSCKVHAFEPSDSTFEMLRARVGHLPQVTLHPVGLGDTDGVVRFMDYGPGATGSGFVDRGVLGGVVARVVEAKQSRLDTVLREHGVDVVDFAKVDTEGFEMPILRSIPALLDARRIRCVQFEYGGTWQRSGNLLGDAVKLLAAHGYETFRLMPDGVRSFVFDSARDEHFKYSNFVAVYDRATLRGWNIPVDGG